MASEAALVVKNLPPCQCRRLRDIGSIPGLGRSPGGGDGNPLQYSSLENPKDRGAWQVEFSPYGPTELDMIEVT